jgi:hypothetical protein
MGFCPYDVIGLFVDFSERAIATNALRVYTVVFAARKCLPDATIDKPIFTQRKAQPTCGKNNGANSIIHIK